MPVIVNRFGREEGNREAKNLSQNLDIRRSIRRVTHVRMRVVPECDASEKSYTGFWACFYFEGVSFGKTQNGFDFAFPIALL